MSAIDETVLFNSGVTPPERGAGTQARPRKRLAIVACMDARIVPERHLGIGPGDVHLIRNAGGRIADAIRSLALSQELLGTEEVMLIHHTACGLMADSDAGVRERFAARGIDASGLDFLTFRDLEASLREDVATYRASPLLRQDISLRTFVFDVDTSRLRETRVE